MKPFLEIVNCSVQVCVPKNLYDQLKVRHYINMPFLGGFSVYIHIPNSNLTQISRNI